jgi:SAM-dependent methyltransferase
MQSPVEQYLVQKIVHSLTSDETDTDLHRILNAGAGQSISIEQQLSKAGCSYICDRIDIENCIVKFPTIGECYRCSIDEMKPLRSSHYITAFANFVIEHVENIKGASQELYRVLEPGGLFIATVPNTSALEFIIARYSPLWFHKLIRGGHAWETKYAYRNISELVEVFLQSGFIFKEERRWPCVYQYLQNIPIVGLFGKLYDKLISTYKWKRLMGHVCLVFQK